MAPDAELAVVSFVQVHAEFTSGHASSSKGKSLTPFQRFFDKTMLHIARLTPPDDEQRKSGADESGEGKRSDPGADESGEGSTHDLDTEEEEKQGLETEAAVMLLGGMTFMMGVVYAANYPNDDVRHYVYNTIGIAISIFVAVLTYAAFNGCVNAYVERGRGYVFAVAVDICEVLFWFAIMELLTIILSGVVSSSENLERGDKRNRRVMIETMLEDEPIWKQRQLSVEVWPQLVAHIVAFQSIELWNDLMHTEWFQSSAFTVFAVLPIALITMLAFFAIADCIRHSVLTRMDHVSRRGEAIWLFQTLEGEYDIIGLTMSVLGALYLEFLMHGQLPNEAGKLPGPPSPAIVWERSIFAYCVFVFASSLATVMLVRWKHDVHKDRGAEDIQTQVVTLSLNITSMSCALGVLFGLSALAHFVVPQLNPNLEPDSIVVQLVIACGASFVSLLVICFLHIQMWVEWSHDNRAIVKMLLTAGLLIGFSWEKCFDEAIERVGEDAGVGAPVIRVLVSLGVCCAVLPVYWIHIMPAVCEHREELHDKEVTASMALGSKEICFKMYNSRIRYQRSASRSCRFDASRSVSVGDSSASRSCVYDASPSVSVGESSMHRTISDD